MNDLKAARRRQGKHLIESRDDYQIHGFGGLEFFFFFHFFFFFFFLSDASCFVSDSHVILQTVLHNTYYIVENVIRHESTYSAHKSVYIIKVFDFKSYSKTYILSINIQNFILQKFIL